MMLTNRQKADALAVGCISVGLPGYYKVKFLLDGQMNWADVFAPAGLLEVLYAFLLATILLLLHRRLGPLIAEKTSATKRLGPIITIGLSAVVAVFFTKFFFNYVVDWGTGASFEFDIILLALVLPLVLSGVADKIFLEGQTREEALRATEAENDALTAKYEALKARLSPHFLFNSLNTLADIVEEDPKLAVRFIERMADIYRYILENRDRPTVPLRGELESIEALLFVLEARHPGAIDISIDLAVEQQDWEVVPLTLQTLFENALKHNHYSVGAPLQVRVYGDGGDLIVENKLNKRSKVPSTKVGLDSLVKRVGQVCGRPVSIIEDHLSFQVRVPMLEPAKDALS